MRVCELCKYAAKIDDSSTITQGMRDQRHYQSLITQ
jgi:hypothetical protein